jgi:hypothetical protein
MARRNFEQQVSPEFAQDIEVTPKAMKELEQDWQKAIYKIAERAGRSTGLNMRR